MIRRAKKDDGRQAARMIYTTIGAIGRTLAGTINDEETIQVLQSFFVQPGNRLSFENTLVAEENGEIAGLLVCYHGSRSAELDRPFLERLRSLGNKEAHIDKETNSTEYYLDTLHVNERYRNKGAAIQLMQAFEEQARLLGHKKLALIVEPENIPAYKLYQKMGYTEDGKLTVSGEKFVHMVKYI